MFHNAIKVVVGIVSSLKPLPANFQFGTFASETHTATAIDYTIAQGSNTFVAESPTAIPMQPNTSVAFAIKGKYIYVVDYVGETHKLIYVPAK
jgi:hypothetical protein